MRTIHLHGSLGREFGHKIRLAVDTVKEAIDALQANFPKFFNTIRNGHFRVIVGKTQKNGMELDEAMLPGFKLGTQDLFIVPVIKGSKRGGLGKIIAGVALIGLASLGGAALAAPLFAGGSMSMGSIAGAMGASLMLTGVATLLAPELKAEENEKSFTMTGPQNTTREGGIIPIAYGRVWTGGTMINGALSIHNREDIASNGGMIGKFLGKSTTS
ncbi:tail assembly protein [Rhodobacter sp. 24-YEA-8]|uniref:tail assembly protein n=1 Tax=Rhodobacter sp. 24-YEA-8 TaxID=1884310 RepID=UPI0008944B91|nr:tail assembly protein [Rhodobacter sp. 24-YEA-8]SEB62251.1 Phage-related protein, tail component [Rhodobacter sp. 24-YEA-8]